LCHPEQSSPRQFPPYNPHARCPKCGSGYVRTRFCEMPHPDDKPGAYLFGEAHFEHLDRECSECGYGWLEATLDSQATRDALETVDPRRRSPEGRSSDTAR
jgi:ribosomal protein S27AE